MARSLLGKLLNAAPVPMAPRARSGALGLGLGGTPAGDAQANMAAYGAVGTIHSIVSLYAQMTGRPEWKLFRKQPRDGRVRYSTMERDPRATFPVGLWNVRPDRLEPVPHPERYLAGWVYTSPDGQEKVPLGVDEVIFVKYPNPLDPYRGLGPVQSVLVDADSSRYSAAWNRNFFLNSAQPGGVIAVDHKMEDDEWDEFQERWMSAHRGVARAHRVAMLEGGMTWVPNAMTMRDMDFAALRNLSRDVIREAFRMHKVMIGVSDDVNRANAQTGEEVFSNWGVVPRLDRWRDVLNSQFLPMFGSTGEGVEFDYVRPTPTNREQDNAELTAKANAASVLVSAGFDAAAVCEVVGLPDMGFTAPAPAKPAPAPALPGETGADPAEQNALPWAPFRLDDTWKVNGNGRMAGSPR